MTFTIYGFRLRGDTEARYVGQTGEAPDDRLRFLHWEAKKHRHHGGFGGWLLDNLPDIETFVILTAETRAEARDLERQTVKVCLALGHRLFNRHLVPRDLHCSYTMRAAA